VAPLYR